MREAAPTLICSHVQSGKSGQGILQLPFKPGRETAVNPIRSAIAPRLSLGAHSYLLQTLCQSHRAADSDSAECGKAQRSTGDGLFLPVTGVVERHERRRYQTQDNWTVILERH